MKIIDKNGKGDCDGDDHKDHADDDNHHNHDDRVNDETNTDYNTGNTNKNTPSNMRNILPIFMEAEWRIYASVN